MSTNAIRAFEDDNYDYYQLNWDFGCLKAGAIFYHDPDDRVYGSIAKGCLKLCWTPDGDCYSGLCGGTVILHYEFAETSWFTKIRKRNPGKIVASFSPDKYEATIADDGTIEIMEVV